MEKNSHKVCVTGGSGYIGSSLVKKLLDHGYTVHATLKNLDDQSKVGMLQSFPGAEPRLKLFKANIHKPEEFEEAIHGCEFVFHVAHPTLHTNIVDATIKAARAIAAACIRSATVKRLIYTASVMAASPLKEDGSGYKEFMDETCWTPLALPLAYNHDFVKDYTWAKTLAEKELLAFGDERELEVVTLPCGLVGGGGVHLPNTPSSTGVMLSQLTNNGVAYDALKFLEMLLAKVPLVHIEDVCDAHIFCIEKASIKGRFICTSAYVSTTEIANYFQQKYPELHVKNEFEGPNNNTKWGSVLLIDLGFKYKYNMGMILDDSITSARKIGDLGLW